MKKVTVSKLKNNLSRYLAYVRKGGRVVVFNRDAPIAELVPLGAGRTIDDAAERHLERLEREGLLTRGTGELSEELLTSLEGDPHGVVDALLDERAGGR